MTDIVDIDDFALYLNDSGFDQARAAFFLTLAQTLCETVVSPLPTGAEIVVLDVAQRAYSNPTSVRNAELGLYAESQGPYSDGTPGVAGGGLWLTENNVKLLLNLAGVSSGGAFTIDTCPATAGQNLPPWDTGVTGWYGP